MSKVLVPLVEGFEDIEAVTIVDVLRRGGVEVVTASVAGTPFVKSSHGIQMSADATFAQAAEETYDAIVLPGGPGTGNLKVPAVLERLRRQKEAGRLICAICAAPTVLVEEFIPGREFTVAVVDGKAWPVIEIVAKDGWYGYEEKYTSNETRYPFLEDGELSSKMQKIAVDAYRAVGCRGVTRVDFRVSPLGRCYVLELNTSPGFTAHSLVPKAGIKTGLTFAGVCDRILQSADYDR